MKRDLLIMLKGFIIGSSMSVPGVSGGTMAILLGIYDKLISAISNFLKDIKGNTIFLAKFCIGAAVGIGTLSFAIQWLLEVVPFQISFFFLGAVVGGIPALYQKVRQQPVTVVSGIYFLLGLIIVIAIGFLPTGNFDLDSGSGVTFLIMMLVAGVIIALALVLPGISTSHMLIVLGMYDSMLAAITHFDIMYIGILGVATLVGIFLVTKPLEWAMNRFTHQTYCLIIGFVIGSTSEIFSDKIMPAIPQNAGFNWWLPSVLIALVAFVLGYQAIMALSRFSND